MTVRIYVDWSGDPGFRFRRGSSTLLLVAAVTSQEQEIDLAPLRTKLALPANYEFHFSKSDEQVRFQFHEYLRSQLPFHAAVVLRVDKRSLGAAFRQMRGEQIIADFIADCIQHFPAHILHNAILLYDGRKEQKSFRNILRSTLSAALKDRSPATYLREVKAVPASQSDGLQTADMLAGLVRTDESLVTDKITIIHYPG
jgi:hypothetical protein